MSDPACLTCREKGRRCDRTRPVCHRCISKGLRCEGYPDRFRFCGLASRGKLKDQVIPVGKSPSPSQDTRPQNFVDSKPSYERRLVRITNPEPNLVPVQTPQSSSGLAKHDSNFAQHDAPGNLDDILKLKQTELLLSHSDKLFLGKSGLVSSPFLSPLALFDSNGERLDIIRSLADPERLCFSSEIREAIFTLSDAKFERVNGCPRDLFLILGNVLDYAKALAAGEIQKSQYEQLLLASRARFETWELEHSLYPNDDPRWVAVAEAFRHACILHTSRLLDVTEPSETPAIQRSVTAILNAASEIPSDCGLIELLVMPLFLAGVDTLEAHARHYVLIRLDDIKSRAGFGNATPVALLNIVWDARRNQPRNDPSNVPWMQFVRPTP
ncbi:hypothetical protein N7510_011844 [Penicillium lagena]|uniref:uncharacterized protein n=1 Tax=Penicillium lagena TaxID=94218 RepID=UPI002541C00C|nr:uncharacterized protein N7510_011844 [Penicillium lagena]KAJ5598894.1 hypothetical protein N7510_011844 [Penicillium lagena]